MDALLRRSKEKQDLLEIIYLDQDQQLSQRLIKVIAVKKSVVFAYCFHRQGLRSFNKENILSAYPYKGSKTGS
ncbi:hypothetical protein MUN89_13520 [Halobacillus salinarum]|uniref:WYL domain-containing protein n=1 Tax=Halobacillus salinarum TaxID=2932257 RepID=A0ABY4EER9_9BACI|nr:hypothetical protein [Halobacillus salinarum]UOQ42970.1 hypothetical protein MUN89_13520 [Halobacillus salinarum]